eukprot:464080-Pleurochrysis_carterae.AAC.6
MRKSGAHRRYLRQRNSTKRTPFASVRTDTVCHFCTARPPIGPLLMRPFRPPPRCPLSTSPVPPPAPGIAPAPAPPPPAPPLLILSAAPLLCAAVAACSWRLHARLSARTRLTSQCGDGTSCARSLAGSATLKCVASLRHTHIHAQTHT